MNYKRSKIVYVSQSLFDVANPLVVTFYTCGSKGIFARHNMSYIIDPEDGI